MELMLFLSLLVLHGACAAALPAPSQGHQDLEFHEDLSTGSPLTMIVGQDLKRLLTETDQVPETHKDLERHERHNRQKPNVMSVLDQVVDEVLQDPDDAELRNAVTQLIKEVENRHAKKHKNPEIGNDHLRSAVDDQSDAENDKVDTHDNDAETSHNSNMVMVPKANSDVIHFPSRNGGRQGHNDVKQTRHKSSGKPHNTPDGGVATVTSDSHGRNANELLLSLDTPSNLTEDLNETIVGQQVESEKADLIDDEDQQVERTLIDSRNSNDDPSFKSWGSDDYSDQYLNNDDAEYDDLIDLRESKESIHHAESDDVGSFVNSDNNNDNVDHFVNSNDEDVDVRNDNNHEVETLINEEIPQNDLNSNLTPVSSNDLFYEDILNNLEASTSKPNNNDLNHVLSADTPIADNSHANDSLKAEITTDNNIHEPETGSESVLRQAESEEIDHDTTEINHYQHSHSKENRYSSESDEPAHEKVSRGCRGHNKIYSLSFRF